MSNRGPIGFCHMIPRVQWDRMPCSAQWAAYLSSLEDLVDFAVQQHIRPNDIGPGGIILQPPGICMADGSVSIMGICNLHDS